MCAIKQYKQDYGGNFNVNKIMQFIVSTFLSLLLETAYFQVSAQISFSCNLFL